MLSRPHAYYLAEGPEKNIHILDGRPQRSIYLTGNDASGRVTDTTDTNTLGSRLAEMLLVPLNTSAAAVTPCRPRHAKVPERERAIQVSSSVQL